MTAAAIDLNRLPPDVAASMRAQMPSERAFPIAFADCVTGPVTRVKPGTWHDLTTLLGNVRTGAKDGPLWIAGDHPPGPRGNEHVRSVSVLALDIEAKTVSDPVTHVKTAIGPEPPSVPDMAAELGLRGWRAVIHTTYSHLDPAILPADVPHHRYRAVLALSRPLVPAELPVLGAHVASVMGVSDCSDPSVLRASQPLYLPRCPAERRELFTRLVIDGEPLDVDRTLDDARRATEALKRATKQRQGTAAGSVIQAFIAAHDVGSILAQHGYVSRGRGRWMHPESSTRMPGVRLLPDSDPPRVFSSHGCCPLNDGKAHDAFGAWLVLAHNRDTTAAVREAARLLGMDHQREESRQSSGPAEPEHGRAEAPGSEPAGDAWPDPHPITVKVKPEPYPLDALPATILAAVKEVQAFVKAPIPMVASCSLSALSLATQGHYDVKRAEKLSGPVSLFLLPIADSGERKTTVDTFFTSALREFQARLTEAVKPELKRYAANLASWKAKQEGLLGATRDAAKKGKPTGDLDAEMERLELDAPEAPRVPRLLLGDETPENLAWSLAKIWPSSGVISSEAGVVFGSHGMGKDSIMRNLALLNVAWDGGELPIGRKTTESYVMRDVRLTLALQIQESTLRSFFERSGGLARGMGFFARFLIAWPESTQGYRPFTEAPDNWPALEDFNKRLTAILDQPLPITEDGALEPAMLTLSPDAKAAWVSYTDAIEAQLRPSGELYDVKDVASKCADNAVRIAALFHVFEGGIGPISLDAFKGASRVAAWHLSEARRFFGELVIPPELVDAAKLDAWLVEHCKRNRSNVVGKRHVRQHGPLRDGARLDVALEELVEMDRVRLAKDGRKTVISINPALCEAGS